MKDAWEIAIIGAGGAGLTAAIYAARAGRRTAIFESGVPGGQIAIAGLVENFPGFPEGVQGADLADAIRRQALEFGANMTAESVTGLRRKAEGGFELDVEGATTAARAVILTAGATYNRLDVPGEQELTGRGVSYCATCDGPFFRGQEVAVVGGGDAAVDEALLLTRFASRVHIIHRRDSLRATHVLQERAFAEPKIDFTWDTVVQRVIGSEAVGGLELRNVRTGARSSLPVAGVFIFIGQTPNSGLLRGLVEVDRGGHAIVDLDMRTSVPGLFAAGDVRTRAARQLVSACGDGATAALAADHYLSEAAR
jgi:thioredoxin reductase (NADPH)